MDLHHYIRADSTPLLSGARADARRDSDRQGRALESRARNSNLYPDPINPGDPTYLMLWPSSGAACAQT
jgi:hypothetical protein